MKKMISLMLVLSVLLSFCVLTPVAGASEIDHGPIVYLNTPNTPNAVLAYNNADLDEYSPAEIAERIAEFAEYFPNAVLVSPPSPKYNCHSYAWYSRNVATNSYWVLDVSAYWNDYSYLEINTETDAPQEGDIALYITFSGAVVHSAVVESVDPSGITTVISKWGDGGLYRHLLYECCYTPYTLQQGYENSPIADQVVFLHAHDHDVTISPLAESDSEHLVKHKVKCENSAECGVDHVEYHNWEMNYIHSVPGEVEIQARPSYVCSECGLTTPLPPPDYMRSVDEAVTE